MPTTESAPLTAARPAGAAVDPTVCMPTWRAFDHAAYQTGRYESQDVLGTSCDLDLIRMQPAWGFRSREFWHRRLVWKDFTGTLALANPGLQPVRLERHYDLFIVVCQTLKELLLVNAIKGWRERCGTTVCVIDELFAAEVQLGRNFLMLLRQFDYVFTELRDSVDDISAVVGRPCHCLAPAVDASRFRPDPGLPRVIDVYSIGRRREGIHRELMDMAEREGLFYVYDTFEGGAEARVADHRAHRNLVANIAKRSTCFMVAPAKWDQPRETRGQIAIANRYFEGAAAGAVLVGQRTETEEFRELFDWENVVVEAAPDGSDVADVVRALKADPVRTGTIGRRNAAQVLQRHDWVYRWHQLFEQVGVQPGPRMLEREWRLRELAAAVMASGVSRRADGAQEGYP